MYPRNATTPPRIAIGAVVQISDGAVQTSGVSVTIRGEGGAEAAGGGTIAYGTSGIVYYTPTQAETNFTAFVAIASKTGCIPVATTVVTTASATAGTTVCNSVAAGAIVATSFAAGAINAAAIAANAITSTTFAAGAITAASIASGALSIAKFAADVGTTAYASNPLAQAIWERLLSAMTTAGSAGKKLADTFVQTGDAFARLGAPAGASVSADIATKATQAELDKVPKKGVVQTWTNQAGDTTNVTVTQA
jgi:hypothetical protein